MFEQEIMFSKLASGTIYRMINIIYCVCWHAAVRVCSKSPKLVKPAIPNLACTTLDCHALFEIF